MTLVPMDPFDAREYLAVHLLPLDYLADFPV